MLLNNRTENRKCERFIIPGSTLSLAAERGLFSKSKYSETFYPVFDLSRGGLRFLSQVPFKIGTKVSLKIFIPNEGISLSVRGRIRWSSHNPLIGYRYQIGVQFNTYGAKKGLNPLEILNNLRALETEFLGK
jgi:Tfp pilus assembly protein PilZ